MRAGYNFGAIGQKKVKSTTLSVAEIEDAEHFLIRRSQRRTFPAEFMALSQSPPQSISKSSSILTIHPFLGKDGLLHLEGRLSHADTLYIQKHPILLSAKDDLTKRIFEQMHVPLWAYSFNVVCREQILLHWSQAVGQADLPPVPPL